MPDETVTLYDAEGNPVEVPKPESANVRQMRERIQQLETQAQEAETLRQQLAQRDRISAIAATGLQLDETKLSALEAVHSGDWTPEAVTQTAIKLGWAQPPPPLVPPAEQDALARMNAAQQGGVTTPPNPEAELDARLAQAKNEAEFMEIYRQSGRLISP